MAFDGVTIAALVNELNMALQDGHIQKIAQPETDELLITIKNNRTNYKLKLSASATLPLFHLTETPKSSPLTAPNFCMVLRKHLNGARILAIEQMGLERVVRIDMENLNELGDIVTRYLYIEIMGKHSNGIKNCSTNQFPLLKCYMAILPGSVLLWHMRLPFGAVWMGICRQPP